jgi:hypothetical protein
VKDNTFCGSPGERGEAVHCEVFPPSESPREWALTGSIPQDRSRRVKSGNNSYEDLPCRRFHTFSKNECCLRAIVHVIMAYLSPVLRTRPRSEPGGPLLRLTQLGNTTADKCRTAAFPDSLREHDLTPATLPGDCHRRDRIVFTKREYESATSQPSTISNFATPDRSGTVRIRRNSRGIKAHEVPPRATPQTCSTAIVRGNSICHI